MDRRPERAPTIALAAAGGWLLLTLVALLESTRSKVGVVARAGAAMGTQSLLQLCLFFAAPFYYYAAAMPGHWVYVGMLGVAGLVTLWTPLGNAAMRHPIIGSALQAVATFAGLDCVLPLVGFSIKGSLLASTVCTAAGLLLVALVRRAIAPVFIAVALVVALAAGGARFVPPAPLRLMEGRIGTHVLERRLSGAGTSFPIVPAQLVCFTAIAAPRGLRDRLHHVWRQYGIRRGDIPLEIRGGRTQGFRTWSTLHGVGIGQWSCTVETESGQRLGRVVVQVGP
jgi:hypothetical protein